ncbi:hypothetical protein [Nitratifractor sp.]
MRQNCEFVAKAHGIRERKTAKGYVYTFGVAIDDREGKGLTEWLQCAIYQQKQRPELLGHDGELHFTGELQVRPAYNDRPQGLQLFGFFVEPVLGKVWRVGGQRRERKPESKPQASPSKPQPQPAQPFPEMESSMEIPF